MKYMEITEALESVHRTSAIIKAVEDICQKTSGRLELNKI